MWIRAQVADLVVLACPALVLPEVAGAVSRRLGSQSSGQAAANDVAYLSIVQLYGLDTVLAQDAAHLAATLRLRGADAIYAALAHRLALPLITWDQELIDRTESIIDARTPPNA